MMRWRGVHHVEFAVLDYDDSITFYDTVFGWLGYSSFSTLLRAHKAMWLIPTACSVWLLRGVLRRPDQRDSLGAGVASENSYTPSGVVVLPRYESAGRGSARSGEDGACLTWQARRKLPSRKAQ